MRKNCLLKWGHERGVICGLRRSCQSVPIVLNAADIVMVILLKQMLIQSLKCLSSTYSSSAFVLIFSTNLSDITCQERVSKTLLRLLPVCLLQFTKNHKSEGNRSFHSVI